MPHPYRSHILDHVGLVAGRFDALGIGEVMDRATRPHPDTRLMTTGDAVNALVLNGLGCVNQHRSLVSRLFQDKPTSRLLAPMVIDAKHLNVDGRDHRDHAPDEQVVPITRGGRRDHRPDLHHVMLALRVEPHAAIPVCMKPLSGHSREAPALDQLIQEHLG